MRRLAPPLIVLFFLMLLAACGGGAIPSVMQQAPAAAPTTAPAMAPAPSQPESAYSQDNSTGSKAGGAGIPSAPGAQLPVPRMVVYNGTIRLEVQDSEKTVAQIEDVLKGTQGYVANRALDRDSKGLVSGSITIRVPVGDMESVLTKIRALGLKVLHEDAKSDDVTQEYTDLDARRKNLEAYEVELTKLLETTRENNGKASDLLAIYNQLTDVRGQIEQIKGRQNYLQNTSALATYTIYLVPHEEVPIVEPEGWDPGSTVRQALHGLVLAAQGLADIGIYLLLFVLPILLLVAIPFIVLFLIVRRLRRGGKAKGAITTT